MDANQESRRNPFGMDEECRNCPALCAPRTQVVHGYGDVGADFLFVGERPGPVADERGIPFVDDESDGGLLDILAELGLYTGEADADGPELVDAYLTNLTRCRHPERPPTDGEVGNCEPFLNAEIRMINPEVIVPVGERALAEIAAEYTTKPPESFDLAAVHATSVRGRGFEIVPTIDPAEATDDEREAFVEAFADLMASDYRQTKGRRGR